MYDLFFGGHAEWFSIPAMLGTGLFLLRLLAMTLGMGGLDVGDDVGVDHHADAGDGIKLISVQTVMAFVMGFGWAGLAAYRGMDWSIPVSVGVGAVGGAAMMWFLAIMLRGMMELQSSGNVHAHSTIGLEGSVYVAVPPEGKGTGQVTLVIGDKQRTYSAVSAEDELPRATRVRVLAVNGNTLKVVRAT